MHYDKKISLALGILLVGLVGALFFRHESSGAGEDVPQLKEAKAIDARIAEKSIRPYASPAKTPRSSVDQHTPNDFSYEGFSDEGLPDSGPRKITQLGPPEPIAARQAGSHAVALMPVPNHNAAWTVNPASASPTITPIQQRSSTDDGRFIEYRVKSGDTLSGIAAQYLGSSSRYREIYEVNRKTMRSPNDLRPGMILRVPARKKRDSEPEGLIVNIAPPPPKKSAGSSTLRHGEPSSRISRNVANGTQPIPMKNDRRFVPVRNSPFILWQRVGTEKLNPTIKPEKSATSKPGTKRKLGQSPPPVPRDETPSREPIAKTPASRSETIPATTPVAAKTYVIRRGDTLEGIAVRYYGTRSAVSKILRANRDRLSDPRKMRSGMTIVLP